MNVKTLVFFKLSYIELTLARMPLCVQCDNFAHLFVSHQVFEIICNEFMNLTMK